MYWDIDFRRNVAAANFFAVSNVMKTPSFATCFARRSTQGRGGMQAKIDAACRAVEAGGGGEQQATTRCEYPMTRFSRR